MGGPQLPHRWSRSHPTDNHQPHGGTGRGGSCLIALALPHGHWSCPTAELDSLHNLPDPGPCLQPPLRGVARPLPLTADHAPVAPLPSWPRPLSFPPRWSELHPSQIQAPPPFVMCCGGGEEPDLGGICFGFF